MLASLDLTPVFSGKRAAGDVPSLRPSFYGVQPPAEFLVRSVDVVRAEEAEDLANPLLPVYWLVQPRDAAEGGITPEVLVLLKAGLRRVLDCSLSPRERLQIWYCLRSLGVQPEAVEASKLLGLIFEFPHETGTSLLCVYSDRFTAAVWEGGSRRWASYEEGAPSVMALDLLREGALIGETAPSPVSEIPSTVSSNSILVAFLYPAGIRFIELPLSALPHSPYRPIYNRAVSLFGMLCSGGDVLDEPPMDLDDPKWVFGSLASRAGAFLADFVLYGLLIFLTVYFSREALANWDIISKCLLGFFFLFLPPLVGAWMESSPAWGFRSAGKHLFHLAVYSTSDSLGPLFVQAFARNLAKWFLSAPFLGCGFLWAFFQRYHRAWHDVLSNTVVVFDSESGDSEVEDPR